jgi:hypothetical protein
MPLVSIALVLGSVLSAGFSVFGTVTSDADRF